MDTEIVIAALLVIVLFIYIMLLIFRKPDNKPSKPEPVVRKRSYGIGFDLRQVEETGDKKEPYVEWWDSDIR